MASAQAQSPCPGCGGLFSDIDAPGPAHAYLGASHGCWAVYCDILAKEYGEYKYPEVHRLTVDSYSAQHPGTPSRQSIQSVAGHLISLYLVLERGLTAKKATAAIRQAIERSHHFVWLPPPASLGAVTVLECGGSEEPRRAYEARPALGPFSLEGMGAASPNDPKLGGTASKCVTDVHEYSAGHGWVAARVAVGFNVKRISYLLLSILVPPLSMPSGPTL